MIRSSNVILVDNHDKLKRMRMFSLLFFVLFTTLQTEDTCTTTNYIVLFSKILSLLYYFTLLTVYTHFHLKSSTKNNIHFTKFF